MSEVLSPRGPCSFCLNARVDHLLSDDNDLSYLSVGLGDGKHRMFIRSGDSRPVAIIVDLFNDCTKQNETICVYSPKFCPECGRSLMQDYPEHFSVYDNEEK